MNTLQMFFMYMIFFIKYADLQKSKYEWFEGTNSWFDAFNACRNKGRHLAVIKSEEEYNEIKQLLGRTFLSHGTKGAYIGFHKIFQNEIIDIFGNQLEWKKIDDDCINYNNVSSEPEDCRGHYVCEFLDEYIPELETTESYYLINRNKVTWPEARSYCRNRGGHLIIINSEEELNDFTKMIKNYNNAWFWAGYHNMFYSDEIILENGGFPTSQYLKWIIPCKHKQKYGALYYTGETKLEDPEVKHAFVCEIKYKYVSFDSSGRDHQVL